MVSKPGKSPPKKHGLIFILFFLTPGKRKGREKYPRGIEGLGEVATGKDFSIFSGFIHSD